MNFLLEMPVKCRYKIIMKGFFMKNKIFLFAIVALFLAVASCGPDNKDDPQEIENPDPGNTPFVFPDSPALSEAELAGSIRIAIDHTKTFQTIEGFGFFGARAVWWKSGANTLYRDTWAEDAISDLGMTMWRNELYSHLPVNAANGISDFDKKAGNGYGQDANWTKQKPIVQNLYNKAKELGVDLKIILTIWSPPGQWKKSGSTKAAHILWDYNVSDLNSLLPTHYVDYGNWLVAGLNLYKEINVPVYAISLQNEPAFNEPYSSCVYSPEEYVKMLKIVAPIVKAAHPKVLVFGAEGMLEAEAPKAGGQDFHNKIINDPAAASLLDRFAVHGYAAFDSNAGISSSQVSQHKTRWEQHTNLIASTGKGAWMTETSGIEMDTWPKTLQIGTAIGTALKYGHISAWVWWQGTDGYEWKKDDKWYAISKHFYRYIRPGAVMVDADCTDKDILSMAFMHPEEKRFTIVILNSAATAKTVALTGTKVPENFTRYRTTDSATDNCFNAGTVGRFITLPGYSIVTLVKEF
jgi:O-glycosyl hydrolase